MYFVRDISCGCDMSLRDEIKEFISYRAYAKRKHIDFMKIKISSNRRLHISKISGI